MYSCLKWRNGSRKIEYIAEVNNQDYKQDSNDRYHKGIFTRISPTIGVEFLTKKIVLQSGVVVKA